MENTARNRKGLQRHPRCVPGLDHPCGISPRQTYVLFNTESIGKIFTTNSSLHITPGCKLYIPANFKLKAYECKM